MDIGTLGNISFSWNFIVSFLSIILIDLILAGDNAVVIAMAVRSLAPKQRVRGIIVGAGGAVIVRVALTFFAAQLLNISFVKFLGGILIIWIALKLFIEGAPEDKFRKEAKTMGAGCSNHYDCRSYYEHRQYPCCSWGIQGEPVPTYLWFGFEHPLCCLHQ